MKDDFRPQGFHPKGLVRGRGLLPIVGFRSNCGLRFWCRGRKGDMKQEQVELEQRHGRGGGVGLGTDWCLGEMTVKVTEHSPTLFSTRIRSMNF